MSSLRFADWAARVTPRGDGDFSVSLDGEAHEVRLIGREGDLLLFEVDGQKYTAAVEIRRDQVEVWLEGRRAVFSRGRRRAAAQTAGPLRAEMAGRVLEVRVKAGDKVAAGDVLLVAETMKMEHPLRAEAAAEVVRVFVAAGDRIRPGEPLIELKPPAQGG
ncbi:MAG: biotin/lipoyl-binding protein [bacterium]|nr:biotin/lipoyl-binding protein [bacterium]